MCVILLTQQIDEAAIFIAVTGITDVTQKNAVIQLVANLKAHGIWHKLKAVYPMVGGTATTHKFNLRNPLDTNAAFRLLFGGGWTHSATGAKGNGTNAYADTFFLPSANLDLRSQSFSYYCYTPSSLFETLLGADKNSLPGATTIITPNYAGGPGNNYSCINRGSTPGHTTSVMNAFHVVNTVPAGIANVTVKTYENGVSNYSDVYTPSANVDASIYINGRNTGGVVSQPTAAECRFVTIGDGLTDIEVANLYSAVQSFNTTLGRNV